MSRFLDAPSRRRYLRPRLRFLYVFLIASSPAACGPRAAARIPLPQPETVAAALQERNAPDAPRLTWFRWRYYGREGNFGGEGALRFDPGGRARVDLLGPSSATVEIAILRGDTLRLVSEASGGVRLPPPAFLWAMAGVFRPPSPAPSRGRTGDGLTVLEYDRGGEGALRYVFDRDGRIRQVVQLRDGRAEQDLSLTWGESATAVPRAAEFRDLRRFRRIRLEVKESRAHAPFDSDLFCLQAC